MSLFDFFFPEEAQASHMRRLADVASRSEMQTRMARARQEQAGMSSAKRIEALEGEVAQLAIIVEALLEKLSDDGTLTRSQLAQKVAEIDARDGVIDGKITPHEPVKKEPVKKKPFKPKLIIPKSD
ncbi:hypothetical protein Rhal01_02521 [Rubritalea halochordaticola]|uniref:Uncharacterized protein n=1 Tax=Rubritalea halochordaticola TaxID=714537 RepID=A0ABP9V0W3_9BACT